MRKKLSKILYHALEEGGVLSHFISLLIFLNAASVMLDTLPEFKPYHEFFIWFEIFSVGVFVAEYIIRLWVCKHNDKYQGKNGRIKYALSFFMVFDVAILLPAIIHIFFPNIFDPRILRIVRVFRIIFFGKHSPTLQRVSMVIVKNKQELMTTVFMIFTAVLISGTVMYYAERNIQSDKFSNIPESMYWAFVTISTIGYGDITPQTGIGKIITLFTAMIGILLYSLPTAIIGASFYADIKKQEVRKILRLNNEIHDLKEQVRFYRSAYNDLKGKISDKEAKHFGFFDIFKKTEEELLEGKIIAEKKEFERLEKDEIAQTLLEEYHREIQEKKENK